MSDFLSRFGKEWLFYDGGMGSLLQAQGLQGGELPETWNIKHPEKIQKVHEDYFRAGADVVLTCTFGANRLKFTEPGELEQIVKAAVANAKAARHACRRDEDGYVALDVGPIGRLLQPMGDLPFEEAVSIFGEIIRYGAEAGCDLIEIETMNDVYEAKAAVLAAKENCDLPICATLTFDESGKLLTGGTIDTAAAVMQGLGVDGFGINCGVGPEQIIPQMELLRERTSVPVILKPNAGLPRNVNGETVYDLSPEKFAPFMKELATLGVQAMGGCCGTTPDHIRCAVEAVKDMPFIPNTKKHISVITSYSHSLVIGEKPLIVGERINPTGKKKFQQALRDHDLDYIMAQGIQQEEAGADILDVNVGLPEIDEPQMIEDVLKELQGITDLPLQIDTSDYVAMERGMRLYNGKPLINSVNGKKESMDAVFPLMKKYGAVAVALLLDENGIPETAEGRLAIAKKIYDTAAEYGIDPEDIVMDGLAMTISTDAAAAGVTLETIRRVREDFGGNTILGVSNISFGLPARELINSTFLTMALTNHLALAIINPNNAAMMQSWRSFLALKNLDPQCAGYIEAYQDYKPGASVQAKSSGKPEGKSGAMTLSESIERGVVKLAGELAREALTTRDPMDLINNELIPALDRVGQAFEKGTLFLPQLLMSADAAKAAFAACNDAMADQPKEIKGRIVIATVKGDIHDIGKNIVKVLLENYGYDVIDLGKDVPPERIVETALKENIKLVGLSALMTTTVVSMEETIKQLRAADPDIKVVVGGAVMTQEYADQIGADAYGKDAMDTVRYAEKVFAK